MTIKQPSSVDDYDKAVISIRSVLCEHSLKDVALSLLVSSLWLPNIASAVKYQLLYAIFLSTAKNKFSKKDKVRTYEDFKSFLNRIYFLLPEFPWIEDYVPEPDWGEIKFHHKDRDYRIFYGNEIGNVYDYLMLFQILYSSRDDDYLRLESRSPSQELQECLSLQDAIISGITTQPAGGKLDISPGDLQIPPENYWNQSTEFFQKLNVLEVISEEFVDHLACSPGSLPKNILNYDKFGALVFDGALLPYYFLKFDDLVIPILPRRFSSILLEEWARIFNKHEKELDDKDSYSKHLATQIYDFLKRRIRSNSLFPFVSAVTKDEKPQEIVFSSSFISKDRLILVYTPTPFSSGEDLGKRLSAAAPKLKEALDLIGSTSVTLGLRAHGQIVRYASDISGETLKPELFIVLSQTSTTMQRIPLSEELPGRTVFLDQFLGVFDEIEEIAEVAEFLEYLEEVEPKLSGLPYGLLDKYGSFKDSSGVLVAGARDPDTIMLYPHWGSNKRYETLSKFWKQYPERGFFDHPRSWRIEPISGRNVRLVARGYFGSAIYCEFTNSHLFTTAAFERMSYHQGLVSNLLMETLEDNLRRNEPLIGSLKVFESYNQMQVNFFPWLLVKENDDFKHLKHLDPSGSIWKSDTGWVKFGIPGVRIVFDEDKVGDALEKSKDCSVEIELLNEVLGKLNRFAPDPKFNDVKRNLERLKSNKPRFKMFRVQKEVSFPEFVSPYTPSIHYLKEAAKVVAQLSRDSGLTPGEYELKEAETKLNALRDGLIKLVSSEVSKYDFQKAMPYLIERTDALVCDYEREISQIERSLEHDVDYQREEKYAKKHSEFVGFHKAYRYLIEKFVQLKPAGKSSLNRDQFQFLASLADKLLEIYATSDSVHYSIYQAGMKVDDDFVMEVKYTADLRAMEQSYGEEDAKIRLGVVGNEKDRVDSPRKVEEFLNKLDGAFLSDVSFSIRSMVNVLQILSQWSGYAKGVKEDTWYLATEKQISDVCLKSIKGIKKSEIPLILDFLTLKSGDVIKLVGQQRTEPDIPVWEYRKRFSRYNLRPLIQIKGKYLWGPYSARRSGIVWSQTPSTGQLPYDMGGTSIQNVIEEEKRLVETALVDKTEEVVRRFTRLVEKNITLSKRDKAGSYPADLGDFDVLAYYPQKNVVINIEDKDLLPPFCLKDAKRVRERIFGRTGANDGYLGKVERRAAYLKKDMKKIAKLLGWQVDQSKLPKVISLFVSRQAYWWTKFPPKQTEVKFLRIDMLNEFIKSL